MFKYVVSKFGLQHQRLAVVGRRDCSRRCRQCLCSRAAGAGGGRWPRSVRAFNPPPAISHCSRLLYSVLARVLYCALCSPCAAQGLSRVEGLCRPGAGRCSSNQPTQQQQQQGDKQGARSPLIVSQQMRLSHPRTTFLHPPLAPMYRNVIYVGRPPGGT